METQAVIHGYSTIQSYFLNQDKKKKKLFFLL
jgi:hypothetical protein